VGGTQFYHITCSLVLSFCLFFVVGLCSIYFDFRGPSAFVGQFFFVFNLGVFFLSPRMLWPWTRAGVFEKVSLSDCMVPVY